MFFNTSLLAAISAAVLIGSASAFTGTATVGFTGTTNCGCPATNGPFAVSIPSALVGTHVCCSDSITITHNGKSTTAIFNGIFDTGAGTQNIQLSQTAFTAIEDSTTDTSLSVTWAFN
ncbi:hypothetical protein DFH09DRAFT_46476 [Mycena vulgaris]|nr:hypothetical protein DFH09DRAFT_1374084 [Mycena vulgaris]KAJ6514077.1 hypothetical protein DFH09DRAFT_1288177 [Mycena vulgaris]KAJ6542140.1 hypothetical protein DFH09DRAFT_46476 [Mycena vulgaris]